MRKIIFGVLALLLLGAFVWLGLIFLKPILVSEGTSEYPIPKELQELPKGENLFIAGVREGSYSFIGDELTLLLVLSYDSESIKIYKEKLNVIDLFPFEIRSTRDFEESFEEGRKVFIKEYKIQCVTCVPGKEYNLPKIPVEFGKPDSAEYKFSQEIEILGSPIMVLFFSNPQSGLIFPLKGPIEAHSNILGLVFLGSGIFLGGIVMLTSLSFVLRFKRKKVRKDISFLDVFSERLLEINQSLIKDELTDLREVLDECYRYSLKLVYLEERIDLWQDSPPESIAKIVAPILKTCEKGYSNEVITKNDLIVVLAGLGDLISYYKSRDQNPSLPKWRFWRKRGG